MARVNDNYKALSESYLFSEIAARVNKYKQENEAHEVISLGIGDVTCPLCTSVIDAMHSAVSEMASSETFRGYAPECGYPFLIDSILCHHYAAMGIELTSSEVFINDGAKSALGHFGDIISADNIVAISDPVYPVYVDTNVMDGRAGTMSVDGLWSKIVYLRCTAKDGFVPQIPDEHVDLIYLCSPNNPTGSVMTRQQLTEWVDYARREQAIILFDAAYESFISDASLPRSIYEIEGARECAVEFCSFSKTAGFTGMRCGYTIVPKELMATDASGNETPLNILWRRHQSTKFNGTAYIIQRAAEAVYTPKGRKETTETIGYYMQNARKIVMALRRAGFTVYGGENAPYIWLKTPEGISSWQFFDRLLHECQIVGTPGSGFGPTGEGYFRLTAFAKTENVDIALERISKWRISTHF